MSHEWIDAAADADLWEGAPVGVVVQGREIALYRIGDELFATDNVCTHGHARLCEGFVEGHEIECPLHQGRFDVRTGQPTCAPAVVPIQTYAVQLEAGRIRVAFAASREG
jgi:naphthalene 1,2-dioxygenase ferredoxin component